MIYLNQFEIEQRYGLSLATGGAKRFNAAACTRHQHGAYKYEFGYIAGYCCYVIIQKQTGGLITVVERQALLARNGAGAWAVLEGKEDQKNQPITFQFTPPKEETKFPSPLFAAHQRQRSQLVIYHPRWEPDLQQVEANPL
ncbi:MAG: hypothetical protein JNK23_09500 [Opitutaceae bacterium]|nr:hypothetical protein [Opitutaceae bacterium]